MSQREPQSHCRDRRASKSISLSLARSTLNKYTVAFSDRELTENMSTKHNKNTRMCAGPRSLRSNWRDVRRAAQRALVWAGLTSVNVLHCTGA